MSKTVWVLYKHHNVYDQEGPTLEAVWLEKPSVEELLPMFNDTMRGCKATTPEEVLSFVNSYENHQRFRGNNWDLDQVEAGARLR